MRDLFSTLGIVLTVVGMLIEVIAILAMGSYPLRRALPFKSPFTMQSAGCLTFFAGVLALGIGRLFD